MILGKIFDKLSPYLYIVFRVFVGALFLQHGAQKLFGMFSDKGSVALASLMGLAGIIEFFGGLLIILGFFTRLMSLIAAIEMVIAYFMAHFPKGFVPIQNGGELALLYFAAFLVLLCHGAKKWSLEKAILKKEIF